MEIAAGPFAGPAARLAYCPHVGVAELVDAHG